MIELVQLRPIQKIKISAYDTTFLENTFVLLIGRYKPIIYWYKQKRPKLNDSKHKIGKITYHCNHLLPPVAATTCHYSRCNHLLPLATTCRCNHLLPPVAATTYYHLSLQPLTTTCRCNHLLTLANHLLSPVGVTIATTCRTSTVTLATILAAVSGYCGIMTIVA
ncbi:unnamed protein product [Brugia pahangi]|uniref:Phlebovirus_G2 domain-containing protein n=1 Tax=Brugia pahangi TaxID=6280 RepID=A0A0N4TRK6_BRUPA|nr:unnamed protein product [Brugia pahangi]